MKTKMTGYTLRPLGLILSAGLAFASPTEPPAGSAQAVPSASECCAVELGGALTAQTQTIYLDSVSPMAILTQVQAPAHRTAGSQPAEVTFYHEVTVGGRTLRPGRYQVQHITSGNSHFVRFTPAGASETGYRPVEVPCTLEPVEHTVNRTLPRLRVEDGGLTLVKLYFAGERAAHAF